MAVTASARLGITRWSAGTDPISRAQLDADHAALDAKVAMFITAAYAAMGSASPAGRFCLTTDTHVLYYADGSAWREVTEDFFTKAEVLQASIHPFLLAGM